MGTKHNPETWIFTCDGCGATETRSIHHHPHLWGKLNLAKTGESVDESRQWLFCHHCCVVVVGVIERAR